MTVDIAKLREVLQAAAQPMPWQVREDVDHRGSHTEHRHMVVDDNGLWVADCGNDDVQSALICAAINALPELLAVYESAGLFKQIANSACPCLHTTPCHDRCTCIMGLSSSGCHRCCTYGSAEQRHAKAEWLVAVFAVYQAACAVHDGHDKWTTPDLGDLLAAVDRSRT